jgi:C_GCAxxG_C_C family probable redox protein
MDRSMEAAQFMRDKGFNCAQSVVKAFSAELGVPEDAAVKMAASFGAGLGRNGLVCGAVTGAAVVLGARFGFDDPAAPDGRERIYAKVTALLDRFQQQHGSILCRELLAIDPKNPEEWKRIRREGKHDQLCPLFVQSCAEILEELLRAE